MKKKIIIAFILLIIFVCFANLDKTNAIVNNIPSCSNATVDNVTCAFDNKTKYLSGIGPVLTDASDCPDSWLNQGYGCYTFHASAYEPIIIKAFRTENYQSVEKLVDGGWHYFNYIDDDITKGVDNVYQWIISEDTIDKYKYVYANIYDSINMYNSGSGWINTEIKSSSKFSCADGSSINFFTSNSITKCNLLNYNIQDRINSTIRDLKESWSDELKSKYDLKLAKVEYVGINSNDTDDVVFQNYESYSEFNTFYEKFNNNSGLTVRSGEFLSEYGVNPSFIVNSNNDVILQTEKFNSANIEKGFNHNSVNGKNIPGTNTQNSDYFWFIRLIFKVEDNEENNPLSCNVSNNIDLSCSNGEFNNSCDDVLEIGINYVTDDGNSNESPDPQNAYVKVRMHQSGNLDVTFPVGATIYSGGGFNFAASYRNTAYWDIVEVNCPTFDTGSSSGGNCKTYYGKVIAFSDGYIWGPYSHSSTDAYGHLMYCTEWACCSASEDCYIKTSTYIDCDNDNNSSSGVYAESCQCDDNGNNCVIDSSLINDIMYNQYKGVDGSYVNENFPDSNVVGEKNSGNIGNWDCNIISDGRGSSTWQPGAANKVVSECTYNLPEAFINRTSLDNVRAKVVYGSEYSGNDNFIAGGDRYYTPVKYNGKFPIEMDFNNLSSLNGFTVAIDYKCSVNCYNKFKADAGYKFYYRPIALEDPFPNGRKPGNNFINWVVYENNKYKLLEQFRQRLSDTYKIENLEYRISLTSDQINEIREYNKNHSGYAISINDGGKSGRSSFIKDEWRTNNATYSPLGELE